MTNEQDIQIMIPAWIDGKLCPQEKLSVHLDGLRHKAVSVFVMRGDQLLLQRRAMEKYHTPGLWANTCCTHPFWDEPAEECAHRRLKDELGVTGLTLNHRGTIEYQAPVGDNMVENEVVDLFTARTDHALELYPNPNEVMATRWVGMADLSREMETCPNQFTPWLQIYLENHADRIFDF
jgi:isopentenyl-diphosphate delta-isomerase